MKKCLLLLLLVLQYTVYGQVTSIKALKSSIDKYGAGHTTENVYIQYDKPVYNPGETIWFKAYILAAEGSAHVSKNFYVDFTDTAGAMLMHGVYPVQISAVAGSFQVPVKYRGKGIHIRAYTRWMLNFDSAFLYDKDIRILQPSRPGNKPVTKTALTASVQFFPEGGDCVAGIKSKLAFKATYNNGMPANIRGAIVNSKGEVVDSITTMHDGMGYFYLTAQPGETYTAQWQDEQAVTYTTALPAVKANGAALQLSPLKTGVGLLISRSNNAPASYTQMHIVGTMQQQAVYIAPVDLGATTFTSGNIPLNQLATGILQVTLLDSNWQPVAERIVFINKNDYGFKPVVHFDTTGTGRREKNVLVINMPDSMEGNLSVAVTDAGVGSDSTDDIISRLLLTGQLKGNVYHPSQYFNTNSDSAAQQLDLVMLTNGWRRFKVNEIIAGTVPALQYKPDTTYLTFGGNVQGLKPGQLKSAGSLMVVVKRLNPADSAKDYFMVPLNDDGIFTQPNYSFYDTLRVYYQFASKKGDRFNNLAQVTFSTGALAAPKHTFYNKATPVFTGTDTAGDYYNAMLVMEQARLAELLKQTTLKNVTVFARVKSRLDTLEERYTSNMFAGGVNIAGQFDLVRDPQGRSSRNAFFYLMGKVPGLLIAGDSATWRGYGPALFIDEVRRTKEDVIALGSQDIAYIKVFRPPFFGGGFGGSPGGAIAIYTRKGDEELPGQFTTGLPEKRITGYTVTKEFYSPDYSIDSAMHMANDDIRSTLYWNPWVLITPKEHTARLPFYNNDITKKMRVIIEGVDGNGRLTRVEKLVE